MVTTKTLRRRFFALAGRLTRKARRLTLHLPQGLALAKPVQLRPGETTRPAAPFLIAQRRLTRPPDRLTASQICARAGSRVSPAAICPLISPGAAPPVRQHPLGVAITPCAQPDWSGSRPRRLDPAPLILPSLTVARPFRWIGLSVQQKCHLPIQGSYQNVDAGGVAGDRGGLSTSMYRLTVSLWRPNSLAILRIAMPSSLAFCTASH